jgi:glycosyltransferase involved in cell wall biosynthesis
MKILHINTYDKGGAATACRRIHLGLIDRGIDSKILYLKKSKNTIETYQFPVKKASVLNKIIGKIHNRILNKKTIPDTFKSEIEIFSSPISQYDITEHPLYKEADIIQLNWVSGFLDEPSFFKKNTKPVIWRLADLYACGGGNHYENNLANSKYESLAVKNKNIRKKALQNANLNLVCISNWVKEKTDESDIISAFPKTIIHNGLDLNVFKPYDKLFSRSVFNFPLDKKIILIGADSLVNKRKGFDIAIKAVEMIKEERNDILLVTFGKQTQNFLGGIALGEIQDERLLAILYAAADIFVMPSLEEAFGQVTIEALACGLPVVSFPNGGSLDIINNGQNGFMSDNFSLGALIEIINKGLDFKFDRDFIVNDVKQRFNINDKVYQYIELYKKILK